METLVLRLFGIKYLLLFKKIGCGETEMLTVIPYPVDSTMPQMNLLNSLDNVDGDAHTEQSVQETSTFETAISGVDDFDKGTGWEWTSATVP